MKITDKNELTPIEEIGGIYFKREDYFKPFKDSNINGGKVRQCLELLEFNKKLIESSCNSKVATHTGVSSPQGLIVAKCANNFGFSSITGIGTPSREASLKKHKLLQLTSVISDVRKIAGTAQNRKTLDNRLIELQKVEDFFIVNFGINAEEVMRPVVRVLKKLCKWQK